MAKWTPKRGHSVGAYRSGLEAKNQEWLEKNGIKAEYEMYYLNYTVPESNHKYTCDFILPNGIMVETKGLFDADDRKKHMLIHEQHPELDIRFVFSSSRSKLYKGSPTTYAAWCEKNGFQYADKFIPVEWLKEKTVSLPSGILIPKKGVKK
ncbi:predicted endonuclease [Citrobacter phage CR8]|uniref:Predicted endonuclease n=1 Tax=Citrobacter phage CR8 TaxID=1455076 RepID=W6PUP3_9CAUD|nr:endonuclease [Citrobacter phage CR8]EDW9662053.1 endonuclease I [Salmonella enterica subsp. enterica serovar Newport]CDM21603.1 predicted endonuclease [Citrobacter phage CR8]